MKKIISLILIISTIFSTVVFADMNKISNSQVKEIVEIFTNEDIINIPTNGKSFYIKVFAKYYDNTTEDITDRITCVNKNPDVAFYIENQNGRILANNVGTTDIDISYVNFTKKVTVNVLNHVDFGDKIYKVNKSSSYPYLRDYALSKAADMVNVLWTPTQNLKGWDDRYTFKANNTYKGIPYSQTGNQVDNINFISKLNTAYDFYSPLNINGTIMPKYGSDCSGFVSIAWNLSRKNTLNFVSGIRNGEYAKVGSYDANNPSITDLLNSYKNLKYGDAVVFRKSNGEGHTFIISQNYTATSTVIAYEQTLYNAKVTEHRYIDLATAGYMPFTLHNMDSPYSPNRLEEIK